MANLLIVEDEPLVQRSLIRALRRHSCTPASNGLEALQLLEVRDFDLVVSDVDMPVMNGVEFYWRAVQSFPSVDFLFRTGSNTPDLWKLGVPVLSKAWPLSRVVSAIDYQLGVDARDVILPERSQAFSEVGGR